MIKFGVDSRAPEAPSIHGLSTFVNKIATTTEIDPMDYVKNAAKEFLKEAEPTATEAMTLFDKAFLCETRSQAISYMKRAIESAMKANQSDVQAHLLQRFQEMESSDDKGLADVGKGLIEEMGRAGYGPAVVCRQETLFQEGMDYFYTQDKTLKAGTKGVSKGFVRLTKGNRVEAEAAFKKFLHFRKRHTKQYKLVAYAC